MAKRKQAAKPALKFDQKLVLFKWILSLLEDGKQDVDWNKFCSELKSPELEGFDNEGNSRLYAVLRARLIERAAVTNDMLLGYDINIVSYWKQITEKRNREGYPLYPKYFQYLSLLFTEIYLDRYFTDKDGLLNDLNCFVTKFNFGKEDIDQVPEYKPDDLNKIAFWSATGSGKTLLMHINILQYKHYLAKHGREEELNRIILLTPNEGLSAQHLGEFELSNMKADIFSKDGSRSLFSGRDIEIIDINKLRDEAGDKTVAVESFEGNNLVLVDEGHRGTSTEQGDWMRRRQSLCESGFSFEYSATFGQAVSNSKTLEPVYVKCIIFDYSYKYFYNDGYGKDYNILNLQEDGDVDFRNRYLTACLLSFYQQHKRYQDSPEKLHKFLIHKPLWVFVGGSVNSIRTENKREVSDVMDIVLFLAHFIKNTANSISVIKDFLEGKGGIKDNNGDIFENSFIYLNSLSATPEDTFDDILKTLFNASAKAELYVENLRGSDGEIALRVGDNEPFGLINVGDASNLCKLFEGHQDSISVSDKEFSKSLFGSISKESSSLNILIGSKKFTEGWSSWRVSTMGLMNIGKSEGSQIIQLFGRGVRLKGYEFCLKRSSEINEAPTLIPPDMKLLETLNIFGVRADYMAQFRQYLEAEGLTASKEMVEYVLPVIKNLGSKKLKVIRLPKDISFKKQGENPTIGAPDEIHLRSPITLDWYPKIEAISSNRRDNQQAERTNVEAFRAEHIAFMDLDRIYFELQKYKNLKAYHNLNLPKRKIEQLLNDNSWYQVFIPKSEFEIKTCEQIRRWEEIAVEALKKYCDKYYQHKRAEFENKHLRYVELTENDPNFIEEYRITIEKSRTDIAAKLENISQLIKSGALKQGQFEKLEFTLPNVRSFTLANHQYQPIFYASGGNVTIKPVALNEGEKAFIEHLKQYSQNNENFFEDKEMYLLRNQSRGRGMGFFEAGNFYPDFILWILKDDKQYISFVDPKGLLHHTPNDPKMTFYKTIKELQSTLSSSEPSIVLNSFIVSATSSREMLFNWNMKEKDFNDRHIFFQHKDTYIEEILTRTIENI